MQTVSFGHVQVPLCLLLAAGARCYAGISNGPLASGVGEVSPRGVQKKSMHKAVDTFFYNVRGGASFGLRPGGAVARAPAPPPGHHFGVSQPQVRAKRPRELSSARASTAPALVSDSDASTADLYLSDLGWNHHYWNTLHFSPPTVSVAGTPPARVERGAPVADDARRP